MRQTKSQSRREILQKLHRVENKIAEALKQVKYRNALKNTCFLDRYVNEKISLILNFEVPSCSEDVGFMRLDVDRNAFVQFTALIAYGNFANSRNWVQFKQQEVFVGNIELVKRMNDTALPSFVRLYVRENGVTEGVALRGVYFDAIQGIFHTFPSISNGECIVVRNSRRNVSLNSAGPSIIKSDSEVVDSIANDQSQLRESLFKIGRFMLNELSIFIDCGDITLFYRRNSGLQVTDMLIGPINLESSIRKECGHRQSVQQVEG